MMKKIIIFIAILLFSVGANAGNYGNLEVTNEARILGTFPNSIPFIVKGASSQAVSLMQILDNSDNELLTIWHTGHLQNLDGMRTVTAQYGPGIWIHLYGEGAPEHTNGVGSYDHTGGAAERYFTATAGDAFTQADEDNGSWILLTGANLGAVAEIKDYIDGTHVVVDGQGWDGDLASQGFYIYKHPTLVSGDGAKHEFSVEATGELEVHSYDFTSSKMIEFENDVAGDDADTLHINHEANGYNNSDAIQIFYETGALQANDSSQVIQISVDEVDAVGGEIDLIYLQTTDATASEKHGIHVGTGFDNAITVSGATKEQLDYGYEIASGVVIDRVNSGGAGDDAFDNVAVNQQIFTANSDYILIGSDATFEVIVVNLNTNSSKDIVATYYYSKAGNNWTVLPGVDDSTQGFQRNGNIAFNAPGDWTKDDQAIVNGDITDAYYIKIVRTYAPVIVTQPIEMIFYIYPERAGETGMQVRGNGTVKLPYLTGAPADLVNGLMWMESDGLHVYYNGGEQILAP